MNIWSIFSNKIVAISRDKRGGLLVVTLVFGSAAVMIMILGVATYGLFEHQASVRKQSRDMAFHIAEAGANYYRWHLAHNSTDYTDGTGQPGPYVHEYRNKNGNLIGYFSLEIDEPLPGSSVVVVRSTGWTLWQPESTRTIQVRLGFPALTDYVFLENSGMNFSFTTEVHGVVHSNGGIRFDGTTDSWVRSAQDRYQYEHQWHDGVWGGGGPRSFWQYPVAEVDFFSVTSDLADIRDMADADGIHLTSSGQEGWHVIFDNDSFDLYRVTSRDCYYGEGRWWRFGWLGWFWIGNTYCYDIGNEVFVQSYDIPTNGAIFVEDDTWVEGVVDGIVSLAVGEFPVQEPYHKLYISNDLTYAQTGSDDVIGLMAQGDVIVPYEVPDIMEINAAMLSQFSKLYRPYYDNDMKDTLTIFGSQISYEGGGWKYVNGWGNVVSGFEYTNHIYDGNLRYYPPPGFPVGNTYELISWEEIE